MIIPEFLNQNWRSKYFKPHEFVCKCGCGLMNINLDFVDKCDELREAVGEPLKIVSGCRCAAHNSAEGGAKDSAHVSGHASDIYVGSNLALRFKLLSYILTPKDNGKRLFVRIGIGSTFIHVDDMGENKAQNVIWVY